MTTTTSTSSAAGGVSAPSAAALSAEEQAFNAAANNAKVASAQSMQVAEKNLAVGRSVEEAAANAQKAVANGGKQTAMQKASLEAAKLKNFGVEKNTAFKGWVAGQNPTAVKCARAVGCTAGAALAINGAHDMFAQDASGERHVGKGFVKMVTGAAVAYGSIKAGRG